LKRNTSKGGVPTGRMKSGDNRKFRYYADNFEEGKKEKEKLPPVKHSNMKVKEEKEKEIEIGGKPSFNQWMEEEG
jgi:hypothetical protein